MELLCRNLFIDTQYLILKSFDFESKELSSLVDLAKSGFINVYITDITDKEIYKKIKDSVDLAYEKIGVSDARVLKSIPAFHDFLSVYDKKNATTKIQVEYEKFKANCQVKVVSSDKIRVMDVFETYCLEQSPFNSNNKKNEFPDAFALMTIVRWSVSINEKTYLLSGDSDWKAFANQNPKVFSFKADDKRFFYIDELSELLDAIIRHEESLKDLTVFADTLVDVHKEEIEVFVMKKVEDCGFIAISVDEDVDVIENYILSVKMIERDIISVDREGATYTISFEIKAVFQFEIGEYGPYDNEDRKYLFVDYHQLYKQHIIEYSLDVEIGFYDGLVGNFEIISASVPADLEIDFDEGEDLDLEDWRLDMPVVIAGVSEYKLTEDGSGIQDFASFRHAKKIFPELDAEKGSDSFTAAFGNKISDPLRFESWLAHFRSDKPKA